jgi:hypothetical protein
MLNELARQGALAGVAAVALLTACSTSGGCPIYSTISVLPPQPSTGNGGAALVPQDAGRAGHRSRTVHTLSAGGCPAPPMPSPIPSIRSSRG